MAGIRFAKVSLNTAAIDVGTSGLEVPPTGDVVLGRAAMALAACAREGHDVPILFGSFA